MFFAAEAAEEEAHPQDEEEVREDGADEGGFDDDDLVFGEGDDGDDHFDRVTECGVEEAAEGFADTESDFFSCVGEQGRQGDDGDEVDDEDGDEVLVCCAEGYANWGGD